MAILGESCRSKLYTLPQLLEGRQPFEVQAVQLLRILRGAAQAWAATGSCCCSGSRTTRCLSPYTLSTLQRSSNSSSSPCQHSPVCLSSGCVCAGRQLDSTTGHVRPSPWWSRRQHQLPSVSGTVCLMTLGCWQAPSTPTCWLSARTWPGAPTLQGRLPAHGCRACKRQHTRTKQPHTSAHSILGPSLQHRVLPVWSNRPL